MAAVGAARWRDARLWGMARIPFSAAAAHALAEEYIRHLRAFKGLARKVLVLDLDETLWGGILGEDGPEGIKLGDRYPGNAFVELQHAALGLHRRGVVLAINSKNNTDEALEVLANHPAMVLRPEHFASTRINWQDKSANMIEIAEELGLGLDSFVFVDDSAVECERMRQALPDVLTVHLAGEPALRASTLLGLGVFDTLSYSEEDRQRGAFYRQEAQRTALRGTAQSIEDFYRSLEMLLTVEPVSRTTLPRAADLTQRTNQFNLTTKRYTEGEFAAALAEPGCEAWVFRLVDRFGDNGIIGLAMLEGTGPTVIISTLLMSCRVLRRTVEDAVLAVLATRARERGATAIEGRYRPTRKNGQTSGFYAERGFATAEPDSDTQRFVRDLATPLEPPAWIEISRSDAGPA
jgi:FkbH-like protein